MNNGGWGDNGTTSDGLFYSGEKWWYHDSYLYAFGSRHRHADTDYHWVNSGVTTDSKTIGAYWGDHTLSGIFSDEGHVVNYIFGSPARHWS